MKWSPPFLWPGHSIQYYNISIINDRRITYSHSINAIFSDTVVSFTNVAEDANIESCNTLEFVISAVNSDSDTESDLEDLTTFRVYGGYIPSKYSRDLYMTQGYLFNQDMHGSQNLICIEKYSTVGYLVDWLQNLIALTLNLADLALI